MYGTYVMLPVEVGEPSLRRRIKNMKVSEAALRAKLDTLQEKREAKIIRAKAYKWVIERRYNMKV